MRLRTQLITATLLFTFVLTVVLSLVFLSELLRERISQTDASNDVLAHQMLSATRTALQTGLTANPPAAPGEEAFQQAVEHALQNDTILRDTLDGFVRYSPTLQDAFISDAAGRVIVSTDPAMNDAAVPHRREFSQASSGSLLSKRQLLFGNPETLDVSLPLLRNGKPFLTAHLGVRSTLLRNTYAPWLRDAALVCLFALGGALLAAVLISAAALRPIEQISRELDLLTLHAGDKPAAAPTDRDAVERVTSKIRGIDEQIRTSEQTRTEMATNLNSMLQTLKDGVMLLTADLRVAMASDAVARFLPEGTPTAPGTPVSDVFPPFTAVGGILTDLLANRRSVRDLPVNLRDGRIVELTLDCFPGSVGALLTLHDVAAQEELEREIQVARRMASIGRLTAGVGHEVKNPINAMAIHLELLRGKLPNGDGRPDNGAQRHVDVLASEMSRLDRVVQTLADFSRPIEPDLTEQNLLPIVQAVIQLITVEADQRNIAVAITEEHPSNPIRIVADAELLRQALLNIALNAMQAMPDGGALHLHLSNDRQSAILAIRDTGTGIPADKLPRIFDLYFTTKASGSGIGLAMTYRIVQLHGGWIEVASDTDPGSPRRGTTFTLRLPLAVRSNALPQTAVSV